MRPEVRQFGALRAEDFNRHPVWAQVHVLDYDQPWYDDEDVDEESFRPHEGTLPVSPDDAMYLVAAEARLADGSTLPGFLTPSSEDDLGLIQPYVFVGTKAWGFWGGIVGIPDDRRAAFHADLGKQPAEVFPLHVAAADGLATGVSAATLEGWSGSGSGGSDKPRGLLRRLFGG